MRHSQVASTGLANAEPMGCQHRASVRLDDPDGVVKALRPMARTAAPQVPVGLRSVRPRWNFPGDELAGRDRG